MGQEVLSSQDYEHMDQGYLIDNGPWQEKIKKMAQRSKNIGLVQSWPTLGVDEFKPDFLPENSDANGVAGLSTISVLPDVIVDAEEKARIIEQNARKSAYEVVEKSRWEADKILSSAREEAEKESSVIRETARVQGNKEGFEQGKPEGFTQGMVEGKSSYSNSIKNLNGLMESLTIERKKLIGDLQPLIVELVGVALKKCLNEEANKGNLVVNFVGEALLKAQDRVHLKLHLNPGDMNEIEAHRNELQLTVGAAEIELIADARIERGGCLLDTEGGTVDVRLNTVVDKVKESLTFEMKK
jgi:flagellar biosynthesis/type III secretory pathway protein FliH